jgi:hypothetical protein
MDNNVKSKLISAMEKAGIILTNTSELDDEQFFKKIGNQIKNSSDIGLQGLIQILTLLSSPVSLVVGATGLSFFSYLWGREQQQKFLNNLEQEITLLRLGIENIEVNYDEFMEEFSAVMEIASKSACEEKRKYLVNAFINSIVPTSIPFTGKQTLWRILSQISVEEIQALKVIKDQNEFIVDIKSISKSLNWNEQDTIVICEALSQLMLIKNASIGQYDSFNNDQIWSITSLGSNFIQWCNEKQSVSVN